MQAEALSKDAHFHVNNVFKDNLNIIKSQSQLSLNSYLNISDIVHNF